MNEIRLYNTLSNRLEPLEPLHKGEVRIYTCGPTVYDFAHIGNFRTFTFQDVLRRFLRSQGLRVLQVMNLTDVDDRIIQNAAAAHVTIREYTEKYVAAFLEDMRALRLEEPEEIVRATDHVEDMVDLIERLQKKGLTYESEGSIYYRISKFPEYGKLSKIDVGGIKAGGAPWITTATKKMTPAILRSGNLPSPTSISGKRASAPVAPAGTSNAPRWP